MATGDVVSNGGSSDPYKVVIRNDDGSVLVELSVPSELSGRKHLASILRALDKTAMEVRASDAE